MSWPCRGLRSIASPESPFFRKSRRSFARAKAPRRWSILSSSFTTLRHDRSARLNG